MQCSVHPSPSPLLAAWRVQFSAFSVHLYAPILAQQQLDPSRAPVLMMFGQRDWHSLPHMPSPLLRLSLAHGVLHLVTIMAATCRRIKRKYLRTPNAWWIQPRHDIWHILHTYRCMYIICTPPIPSPSTPLGPFCNFPTIGNIRNSFCALCIKCIMYHPLVGPLSTPDPLQCLICFLLNRQSASVRVCACASVCGN